MKRFLFFALSLLFATTLNAQLSGTYTINSNASQNPDYTSFGAAVSALSAGVSGPVTFQVAGKKARTATLPANSLNTFVF